MRTPGIQILLDQFYPILVWLLAAFLAANHIRLAPEVKLRPPASSALDFSYAQSGPTPVTDEEQRYEPNVVRRARL